MDNEEYRETRNEGFDHAWHSDESTMWSKEPPQTERIYETPVNEPVNARPEGNGAFRPAPENRETPKKAKKKGSAKGFFKVCGICLAGLMLVFSSATSAYLLKEHIEEQNVVTQSAATVAQSESGEDVAQKESKASEMSVADINTKVAPSVVLISGSNMTSAGEGSGFIVSDNGYIVTNAHVVSGFSEINVTLNDEKKSKYPAEVVGIDETTDIAVIRIKASNLTAAEIGTSASLQVGQSVVVIGNPLGAEFSGSVTTGIVSALDRTVEMDDGQCYTYIQTNAAINSGNSGGPLMNMQGQVIGITSAKIDSSVAEGMGFAIPIDTAVPVMNDLMQYGYVKNRPYIGISGETMSEQYAAFYNLPAGVRVVSIAEGSPAAKADLQVDDIITAINGTEVTSVGMLNNVKNRFKPGDTVKLTVYRYKEEKSVDVEVVLGETVPDIQ